MRDQRRTTAPGNINTNPNADQNFDNGLASVYIGPSRVSATIHLLKPPVGDSLVCMPRVPLGRLVGRPEAQRATCGRCLSAQAASHRRNRG